MLEKNYDFAAYNHCKAQKARKIHAETVVSVQVAKTKFWEQTKN